MSNEKKMPVSLNERVNVFSNEMHEDLKKNATFDIKCRKCRKFKIYHINRYCTLSEVNAAMRSHYRKAHKEEIN